MLTLLPEAPPSAFVLKTSIISPDPVGVFGVNDHCLFPWTIMIGGFQT